LQIADLIEERGPLTVAAFMELALYDPAFGYYARAAQRSGRAGDFFTSVDVGPVFGELLEIQLAEMATMLQATAEHAKPAEKNKLSASSARSAVPVFDLVEAGAGNGRLSADILRAARDRDPGFYSSVRLHLVEASAAACGAQAAMLGDVGDRLSTAGPSLPDSFEGVLVANELLDAFPVHQVVMREEGLREVYVVPDTVPGTVPGSVPDTVPDTRLKLREGPLSTTAVSAYLSQLGVTLEPGWRVEINLHAVEWIRDAARRLRRGFIIVIDYGHEARELYSVTHSGGTLTSFSGHTSAVPDASSATPPWLQRPGGQDLTAHVDFTSVRNAAEAEGLQTLGFLDQTYFILGLVSGWNATALAERAAALKTLLVPGGLGSTHKVMIFGKGVGTPSLRACSFKVRVT
jgi:SAM-dependent MidA family methyltransferase